MDGVTATAVNSTSVSGCRIVMDTVVFDNPRSIPRRYARTAKSRVIGNNIVQDMQRGIITFDGSSRGTVIIRDGIIVDIIMNDPGA